MDGASAARWTVDGCRGAGAPRSTIADANLAQAAVNVVDFYLDDSHAAERAQIIKLVNMNDQRSADLLRGYVCEAMSMLPVFIIMFYLA